MAHLYQFTPKDTSYARRNWRGTPEEYEHALETSTTVYVGNLSFFTREEQIWELFSTVGEVKRVVMGLNKHELTPCGFCFVEFFTHEAAEACVSSSNGSKLDEHEIKANWDTGFVEGRQFGRGSTGGQLREDYKDYFERERAQRQKGPNDHGPRPAPQPRPSPSNNHRDSSDSPRNTHHSPSRDGHRDRRGPSPTRHSSPHRAERDDRFGRDDRARGDHRGYRDNRDRMDHDDRHGRYDDRYSRNGGDRYDDHHGGRHPDQRFKRGREDDRFYDRHSEPMVDEFGRDLPPKKPKLSE